MQGRRVGREGRAGLLAAARTKIRATNLAVSPRPPMFPQPQGAVGPPGHASLKLSASVLLLHSWTKASCKTLPGSKGNFPFIAQVHPDSPVANKCRLHRAASTVWPGEWAVRPGESCVCTSTCSLCLAHPDFMVPHKRNLLLPR